MRRLWLAAPLTLLATAAAPAYAYFCTLAVCDARDAACTSPRPTQAWQQRCIPFYVSTSGSLFDGTAGEQLVIQSFGVWSGQDCTDLDFKFMGRTTEREAWNPNNPADNKNVIASVEDSQDDFEQEPRLLALTLTRYAVATGEIFDADIIVNAVDHEFDDVADGVACRNTTRAFDLRNTLVHEMGHFIGFDHTPVQDATMFASADTCEVAKRDLASDDMMGICAVYPKGGDTRTCTPAADYTPSGLDPTPFRNQCDRKAEPLPTGTGGCSCATQQADAALVWVLVGGLALALRRRAR
jgi:MYXO-CTERM domain-containing protein